ncbi:hypothetical protein CHI12_12970 [Terribacillus saccharophilus]|jgi:hypothetical protein|uniref:DUF4830 domain-containing protein n=1 Tax=Terribacillus saccharophilus TaxID=361277 RepID=A0A268HB24_9BACI|nr:hypothetical protein CHI12_12970 [Terribacillus saccharophilus]
MRSIFIFKKKVTIIIFCVLAILGILIYFAVPYFSVKHDKELEVSLNKLVKEEDINTINIGDLITYDWQKAYMFHPYTEEADMKDVLGLKFHDPVGMALRDDIELFVVVKDDNTFEYAKIQLGYGYLSMDEEYLTPENDLVEITQP